MAKTKISEFSTTPGDNTDINGINIAEGCAPSGINNAIRELMSDLKEWQSGAMDVYVVPQGTAAAPGIQFYSDTNTGIYRYAADQLGIAVGGVSAGYFSSDGWVGNVVATTIDLTNIEVTNIKAKDGTAAISIADSTGKVTVSSELAVDNLNLSGNTFSSTDTNGNIVLAPNGTGDVYLDADTIRVGDANSNVTVTTNGTGDLILNTNSGTNSGAITIEDGVNGNILIATNGTGQVQLTGDLDVTTVEVTNIKAKDGTSVFTLTDSTGAVSIANAVTMATTTQNIALGTSQTSGTFTVGGAAQTGTQTFDQSTKTHTLNIGTGATESAATKTINIGTGGVATSTTAIAVGSTNGTTITLNGTVNATTVNATTLDLTNLEVTNIKAKDGTASITLADSTGVATLSANPILNAGTANGVVYLNASKSATSGSALIFDGTNLGIGRSPTYIVDAQSDANGIIRVRGGTGTNQGAGFFGASGSDTTRFAFGQVSRILGGTPGDDAIIYSAGYLGITAGGATERLRITSGGFVNIGGNFTSTNNTLQVTGNAAIGYTTAAPTTGLIVAGDVGIGTSSPGQKLQVEGTASFGYINSTGQGTSGLYLAGNSGSASLTQFGGELRFNTGGTANTAGTSSTERMRLDASGNLGLGVTPSAWGSGGNFELPNSASIVTQGTNAVFGANWFFDTGFKYKTTAAATYYQQTGGAHRWYQAASGTAGNAITFTQAMTLDASGNVGIGATAPSVKLQVNGSIVDNASGGYLAFQPTGLGALTGAYAANNTASLWLAGGVGNNGNQVGHYINSVMAGNSSGVGTASLQIGQLAWSGTAFTSGTAQMTLNSSGNLGLGATPSAYNNRGFDISNFVGLSQNSAGAATLAFNNFQNSAGNYIYKTTNAAARYDCGNEGGGRHAWFIAGSGTQNTTISFTQAMTLDASGNLGVGVTSIQRKLHLGGGANDVGIKLSTDTSGNGNLDGADITFTTTNTLFITNRENGATVFETNGSERARIDSSGNLLLGKTADNDLAGVTLYPSGNAYIVRDGNNALSLNRLTSDGTIASFSRSTVVVGSISVTTTATAYNTSSDYRLKNIDGPLTGSGEFIDALKPKVGTWKADGSKFVGFLAHEVQEVSPSSVIGEKDAVDEDGNPIMQAMEYGSAEFIANIIAELQSLRARVAQLEGK